ncbi:hypothetical protein [Bacillus sp. Marseille-P3661]|uniref:hypothetical protein n=1 Tax=Bacillus sp. Marseille-P3661 TaxID=1936234 RepID=UPI000C8607A3|nr:hypothetical protein [Bacillus sp. Marseille-P3661]
MGYILPLNHEQYTQYANRTIMKKHVRSFTLAPVYKVTLHTKMNNSAEPNEQNEKPKPVDERVLHEPKGKNADIYMADITGKGTLFNEVV